MVNPIREAMLAAALATGAATGPQDAQAQQPAPMVKPADTKAAPAPKEKVAQVDVSDTALTEKTPVALDEKKNMQFTLKKLPAEKKVELVIAAEQVFQFANVVDKKGNLLALVLPNKDGKAQVLEVPNGTEVQITVMKGKDKLFSTGSDLVNLTGGKPYNWMEGLAQKIEKKAGWDTAKNTNAIEFFKGNLLDNLKLAIKEKRLVVDEKSPLLAADNRVNWDGAAQTRIETVIKGEMKK